MVSLSFIPRQLAAGQFLSSSRFSLSSNPSLKKRYFYHCCPTNNTWRHGSEAPCLDRQPHGCGCRAPMDGPGLINMGRVSAGCFRFISVVNNGYRRIQWQRDMNCVSPPKTRREPIHGGSNPASMRDTVFGRDTQSMPLIFVGQQWYF